MGAKIEVTPQREAYTTDLPITRTRLENDNPCASSALFKVVHCPAFAPSPHPIDGRRHEGLTAVRGFVGPRMGVGCGRAHAR